MFDSSWSRFKRLAEDTKLALRRNRELLREAKETASMREIQALREHLEQQGRSTTLKDAEASKERRRFQRQEVAGKLAPPNYSDDQCDLQDRMHESARGDWLLGDRRFTGWADAEDEEHKILNLNGCPGAGTLSGPRSDISCSSRLALTFPLSRQNLPCFQRHPIPPGHASSVDDAYMACLLLFQT